MKKTKTKYPVVWEQLDESTSRRRIHGGWLVWSSVNENSECMCFVPDKNHDWIIIKPENIDN